MEIPRGLICQSCAMPMEDEADFGRNRDGLINKLYCKFCYQDGEFTMPDLTLEEQIERLVELATQRMGMTEEDARAMAGKALPNLQRWQTVSAG